jgi:protein subunit release factor A
LSWHNLPRILDGDLDEVIDALIMHDQAEKLKQAGVENGTKS